MVKLFLSFVFCFFFFSLDASVLSTAYDAASLSSLMPVDVEDRRVDIRLDGV